ncbi:hypothetical protein KKP91_04300 [Methanothermococcus sp. SCGC AD-155-M21]|nr:hypothetical protein [Methanothermococcus sp. SCGC AD-155-M21]
MLKQFIIKNISKYKLLSVFLVLSIFVMGINLINAEEPSNTIVVDNSPYPEFIYIDNEILPEVSKIYINEDIPSFLFYFIEGIYLDGQDSGGVAIKTPLWYIVKLVKILNLFSEELENIHPENGFLFINSKYKGAPEEDDKGKKYIIQDYDDLIVYLNDTILCAKFHSNNTAYFNMAISKDKISYEEDEDERTIVELINGLKSINGIKVKKSNAKIEGDIVVIDMVLDANASDIVKLTNLNLNYVPIKVKVKGDWIKENDEEDKYIRNSDYMIIYTPPLNKDATLTMINDRENISINLKEKVREYNHQGWYVEEYQYNYKEHVIKKQYICIKELEYGTVCIITNKLENLKDVEIYEEKS